jgi:hypothetical protein
MLTQALTVSGSSPLNQRYHDITNNPIGLH